MGESSLEKKVAITTSVVRNARPRLRDGVFLYQFGSHLAVLREVSQTQGVHYGPQVVRGEEAREEFEEQQH